MATEGLLACGGVYALVADPKAGKTIFATDLTLKAAAGLPWLGRATKKTPVVLAALEDSVGYAGFRAELLGCTDETDPDVFMVFSPDLAKSTVGQLHFQKKRALIIIDTMRKMMNAEGVEDENSAGDTDPFFQPFVDYVRETGGTILFLAHRNKGGGFRGSSAIPAALDGSGMAEEVPGGIKIAWTTRWGNSVTEVGIEFPDRAQAGGRIVITPRDPTGAPQETATDKVRAVFQHLGPEDRLTQAQVVERSGLRTVKAARGILDSLEAAEEVARPGGVRGGYAKGLKLKTPSGGFPLMW